MSDALYRTDYMLKYLRINWKYWDDSCMSICKEHDGKKFNFYVAIENKLIISKINPKKIEESLKTIEENRVFKLKKIILPQI